MTNNRNVLIFFAIIAAIGLALFAVDNFQFNILGSTVLSVDEVDLRSSVSVLDGKAWLVRLSQGGLGQSLYGTRLDPEDIGEKNSGEETPEQGFDIRVDYEEQQCVYPIEHRPTATPVRKVDYVRWGCVLNPSEEDAIENIRSETGIENPDIDGLPFGKVAGITDKCFAFYSTQQYPTGILTNADIRTRANIILDIEGEGESSLSIDSENQQQGKLGDIGYAIYNGNLDLGKSCKYTTDNPFTPVYQEGKWSLINEDRYEDYRSEYIVDDVDGSSAVKFRREEYNVGGIGTISEVERLKQDYNAYVDEVLIEENFGSVGDETKLEDAVVRNTIQDNLQNPEITLFIKADTLGVYTPSPELEVVSEAESACFKTGQDGVISVNVKNTGDESGVWNAYAECSQPFDVVRSETVSLDAGETRNVFFDLRADTDSQINGQCTINFESPSQNIEVTAETCVDPQTVCSAGTNWCAQQNGVDAIQTCNEEGSNIETELCSTDQYCSQESGEPQCVDISSGSGSSGDGEQSGFNVIAFIIALAVGGFVAFYVSKLRFVLGDGGWGTFAWISITILTVVLVTLGVGYLINIFVNFVNDIFAFEFFR